MAGGEQHAWQGEYALRAARDQLVEPVADDGCREFKESVLDIAVGKPCAQGIGNGTEFVYGAFVAAAVAAHHYGKIFGHVCLLWAAIDHACTARPRAPAGFI